jgi:uncharacterized protein YciI
MFFVQLQYKPDADLARFACRAEHIEYMIAALPYTKFGGPLLADQGDRSSGAIFVLDLPDRAAVEKFVANEPFFRNGLFESVLIRRWRQMAPEPFEGFMQVELKAERERRLAPGASMAQAS